MIEKLKQIFRLKKYSPTFDDRIANLYDTLYEDVIQIKVGSDIVPFGEKICSLIFDLREEFTYELGFIIPSVHILDNSILQENEYVISIKGIEKFRGFVIPNEKGIIDEIYESLKNVVLNNINLILTNEITEKYIEKVRLTNTLMIWDITGAISTTEIRIILTDLLEKGKSIKNISEIFEKISEQIYVENKTNSRSPHKIAAEICKQI